LLNVWESGATQASAERALALLAAACPDTSREVLAELSIGRRDAHLLTLREWAFGPQVFSVAVCPQCGERLEIDANVAQLRVHDLTPSLADTRVGRDERESLSLQTDDYVLSFRLPNSIDLAAIAEHADAALSRRVLVDQCVLSAQHKGAAIAPGELPDEVIAALSARMAEANPQADVQLALTCSSCGHRWEVMFDIGSLFWREIRDWAQRTLREVHTLASAYGWSQAEILGLSATRRQIYLELIGNG